jgi:hypothetical protein
MADTTQRVQRWRQRLKDEGKEPLTIYLAHDEKLRLDDLAHTWHCSPSAIVQQAVAAFRPGSPSLPTGAIVAPVDGTETARLRALIQEEMAQLTLQRLFPQDPPRVGGVADISVTATFQSVPETPAALPWSAAPASTVDDPPEGRTADIGRAMSTGPAPVEELCFAPDPSARVPDVLVDPPDGEPLPLAEGPADVLNPSGLSERERVALALQRTPLLEAQVQARQELAGVRYARGEETADSADAGTHAVVLPTSALDYDPTTYVLGTLCPGRHQYQHTGQSLLTIKGRRCDACENATHRAKRPRALDYDPAKFSLGTLCSKEGHAYRKTGQSLRTKHDRCRLCLNEANEKSRQRKKEAATSPA